MNPKITISIVIFKNYKDAAETVDSIERNTSNNIKKLIYIIDNSQSDLNSSERNEFVRHLKTYSDVVYIDTGDNLGFGKGHNYVLNDLQSEYHAIVNPDILLTNDAFSTLIAFMDRTDSGMSVPRLVDESGKQIDAYRREITVFDMFIRMFTKTAFQKRRKYHSMCDQNYSKAFHVPFAQGSFLIIKTSLWKQLNGFDDRYFMYLEDADLCRRVNQISRVMYCPDAMVIHKWEKGSHKDMKLFYIHLKSMVAYFNKWGWKLY